MLGLIALLDDEYYIRSNRESGEGRFDICLEPKDHRNPGVIMEFKAEKGLSSEALENLAVKARDQIEDKHYDQDMKNRGIEKIMKLGVAFSGKEVKIIS